MLRYSAAKNYLLVGCLVILLLVAPAAQPAGAQGGSGSYGLAAVGHLGYGVQVAAAIPDGILLAEGSALLRLTPDGQPAGQIRLARGDIQDIMTSGWRAYVLTESGLAVIDAQTMTVLAFTPGGGQALELNNRQLYVAAQQAGLRSAILNNETGLPESWQIVPTPGDAVDLAAHTGGGVLYVALGEAGIGVYTLDHPPALLHTLITNGSTAVLQISAGRLWVGSEHRLYSYDLSDPAAPQLLGSYVPLHAGRNLLLRREWAYIADPAGGLLRYDIGDLSAPRFAQVAWPGTAYDLGDDGRFLYVAAGGDGAVILDADSRVSLQMRGRLVLPGAATAIAVEAAGDQRRAVIGLGEAGVAVTDWTDPDAPRLMAAFQPGGMVHDVALRENIGFAAVDGLGLVIFSLSDPASPRLLATVPLPGTPRALALSGTTVYIAADSGGLVIVEALRPAEPVIIGGIAAPRPDQPIVHVALEGKRAYLSTGGALLVADIDVPAEAQILAAVEAPASAAIARDFIVYTIGGPALSVLNAASSNAPRFLSVYRAADRIGDIWVTESAVWLAGTGGGAAAARLAILPDGSLSEETTLGIARDGGGRLASSIDGRLLLAAGTGGLLRIDGDHLLPLWQSTPRIEHLAATAAGQIMLGGERLGLLNLDGNGQPAIHALAAAASPVENVTAASGAIFTASSAGIARYQPDNAATGAVLRLTHRWLPDAAEGTIHSLAADGALLYALGVQENGQGRLHILTADTLFPLFSLPLPGTPQALTYRTGYLYVAYVTDDMGGGGVAVINAQNPTAGLERLHMAAIPAAGISADMRRGYAIQGATVTTFDAANWPDIEVLHTGNLPLAASRLLLSADERRLLALAPGEGLLVLDLFEDGRLFPVAALTTLARDFTLYQDTLYLAEGDRGLKGVSLDILNDLEARLAVVDSAPTSALWRSNNILYAAGRDSLRVYDLAVPGPSLLAVLPLNLAESEITALSGRSTRRDGHQLYLSTAGEVRVALHRPDNTLVLAAPLPVPAGTAVLAADADHVYLRLPSGRFGVLLPGMIAASVGNAAQFTYPLPGNASPPQAVAVLDQRVLVGTAESITVLAWGSAAAQLPALAGQVDGLPGQPSDIVVGEGMLYVAASEYLWQLALDAPEALRPLPTIAIPGGAAQLTLAPDGRRLAVLTHRCGLRLYDLGAGEPQEIGRWDSPGIGDVASLGAFFVITSSEGITTLRETPEALPSLPVPQQPDPPDGAVVSGSTVTLRWLPAPDECLPLHYEVWTASGDAPLVLSLTSDRNEAALSDLPQEELIRWQVRLVAMQGRSVSSPEWRFFTGNSTAAPPLAVMSSDRVTPPTPTAAPPSAGTVAAVSPGGSAFPPVWAALSAMGGMVLLWAWVKRARQRRRF